MIVKNEEDLERLRTIGVIVADTLVLMMQSVKVGMTTLELDEIGGSCLKRFGATSAPKLTYNFPGYTCISLNHEIAHGVPSDKKIQAGDLINIDVSAELDGYFADTGGSFSVSPINPQNEKLCSATAKAMYAGISAVKSGEKLSVIGKSVEKIANIYKYSIIENLGSHGVGRALHEEPKYISSTFDPKDKRILKKGMIITVEPFLSTGEIYAEEGEDGWTLCINKKHKAAQFEHTIMVTDNEPIILTIPSANAFF
ncbi:type I methionyl aminopeptidase [Fluviispira multicolorata]|uniref:Methionine aminopeptidase n=1 Tax=Fluviispira multicolorata TaxID=2654512 RepID=A0A833N3M3_9BACT|nr:type I methionyl aminopeptidase [Fluviispira multicolorata]KAB8029032.1 type I methionyl aminopeptidase [Fluviispira multicolorata]